MPDNMEIYNALRTVPENAQRRIEAGRLKGKTDINPMWRIKALTEQFGPCGVGWKYEITRQWLENGANNEISAFCNIVLYVKYNGIDGPWSDGIPGTGGSAFVTNERNGLYTSDECYKMALTDALSVACKALGVAADVYWDKDTTKYSAVHDTPKYIGKKEQQMFVDAVSRTGGDVSKMLTYLAEKFPKEPPISLDTITPKVYEWAMKVLKKRASQSG